ncbi:MAG: chromosomal replication initiator protein DnaA [Kiritimatiellae bacterium]|nr:chromosomal replication initiator protein DnaA [Kiritimatiellia bacterium]
MNETIDIASKEMWERAKGIYLSTLLSSEERNQVDRYLSMIVSVSRKEDDFVITTSNSYAADYLRDHYSDRLRKCLELVSNGNNIGIVFRHEETARPAIVMPEIAVTQKATVARTSTFSSTMPLSEEYTFDEFVRGPSNSWALAAAQGVVSNPGKSGYNPLFIHGGTGLGKTHLMQAIGNELKRKSPEMAICYLTAETFLNEYVNALKNGQIESFRNRYRKIDLLMVDDVQFLQKGKQFQEEFFNTFCALWQAHKQIVMTSDVAPKNLPAVEERLISRFEGGMVQEIESPNYETRLAILRKKSEGMVPQIPDKALEFIADTIKSHVRAMEGALHRVSIFRSMDPTAELSKENLAKILKDFIEKEQSLRKLTIEEIQATVAKKYSVTISQILSTERTQSIVTPRQLAMYIARKFTTKSLPEIAKMFDKTHATIIHGVKNIEKRMDVEEDLRETLNEILSEFGCDISDRVD